MLLNFLSIWYRLLFARTPSAYAGGFRLAVEELEGRRVPAKYHWESPSYFGSSDANWSTVGNWKVWNPTTQEWDSATSAPGLTAATAIDEVEFDKDGQWPCNVDAPVTVRSLKVWDGYANTITLYEPLTVASPLTATPTGYDPPGLLLLNGESATISGPGARGSLSVTGHVNYDWIAGKLNALTVTTVGAPVIINDGLALRLNVMGSTAPGPGGGPAPARLSMTDTNITVGFADLNWHSGDVAVLGPAVSRLTIAAGSAFQIMAANVWGTAGRGPVPDNFVIQNEGIVTSTASATLNGNFTNIDGEVGVNSNVLTFGGLAEQTAGTFEIASGATAKLTGDGQVLRIYDGLIGGSGTVDGNLTLGYDPGYGPVLATSPVLRAGPADDTMGNLTVKQSFQAFSAWSNVLVKVGDGGATSKLVVLGHHAALLGNLTINWANTNPPSRSEHVLVDIAGQQLGAFSNFAEMSLISNQDVFFRKTYLGGTGNDVSLLPTFTISGRVFVDRDHDGHFDFLETGPKTWRNEWWQDGVRVQLIDENGDVIGDMGTYWGGGYAFSYLLEGAYTVRVYAPYERHTFTNVGGYVGLREADIETSLDGSTDRLLDPIGVALPMMRTTVGDGTYDMLSIFDGGDYYYHCNEMAWEVHLTDGSEIRNYADAATLYLSFTPTGESGAWAYNPDGYSSTGSYSIGYVGDGFTLDYGGSVDFLLGLWHVPEMPLPESLSFDPIFPGDDLDT